MNKNKLKILKKYLKKKLFFSNERVLSEMSDEKNSDSEFYYPEEQETAERNGSCRGRHFVKVEATVY